MTETLSTTEARAAVEAIVKQAGVTFTAVYRGLDPNAMGGSHPMDQWSITLADKNLSEKFDYFTGLGHRAEPTEYDKMTARYSLHGVTLKDIAQRTICGRRYLAHLETLRKPKAPHIADVLHSLVMDSSAVGQSFSSWCDDFGYDKDSRKAESIYRSCQENSDKIHRLFGHTNMAALAEALQDY